MPGNSRTRNGNSENAFRCNGKEQTTDWLNFGFAVTNGQIPWCSSPQPNDKSSLYYLRLAQPTAAADIHHQRKLYIFIHPTIITQLLPSPDPNLIPNLTPYPFSDSRLASPYPLILLSSIPASCHHSIIDFLFFFAVTESPAESTTV